MDKQLFIKSIEAIDCSAKTFISVVLRMTHNVLHIAEGGNFGAENLNIKQMFNRSKNVHITTKLPLLAICCYVPFFFTNQ